MSYVGATVNHSRCRPRGSIQRTVKVGVSSPHGWISRNSTAPPGWIPSHGPASFISPGLPDVSTLTVDACPPVLFVSRSMPEWRSVFFTRGPAGSSVHGCAGGVGRGRYRLATLTDAATPLPHAATLAIATTRSMLLTVGADLERTADTPIPAAGNTPVNPDPGDPT